MRVIGTAGHVDHGKSSLVRRLTGIDPDRLQEEKRRALTIDLGFAWMTLPDGETIGIVDVPGHRDFIENMLAGVGGIDAVLLVIAADEGVMPQTREHLAILDLLGQTNGLVVLTKVDLIDDPDWLALIEMDVREALAATTLHDAVIIPVSSQTGDGIDTLTGTLQSLLADLPPTHEYGNPRLPIDRVFTISGFGTVVTGTLRGGSLRLGDEVAALPSGFRGRVRGLQSYQQSVEVAQPGSRVAVNVAGIEKSHVSRGEVLTFPDAIQPSQLIDVQLRYLPDATRPLKHNAEVKFFSGAAETVARVRLLDDEQLLPDSTGWVQLRLASPMVIAPRDRFIIRYPSPPQTVGGGVVVNPHPARRWKRFRDEVITDLQMRFEGTPAERLAQLAMTDDPIKASVLQKTLGYDDATFADVIDSAIAADLLLVLDKGVIWATTRFRQTQAEAIATLSDFHHNQPLKSGMSREALRGQLGVKGATLQRILDHSDEIETEGGMVRLAGHEITFSPEQEAAVEGLSTAFGDAPYTPPSYKESIAMVGEDVVHALIERGDIIAINDDVLLARPAYNAMAEGTLALIDRDGSVTAKSLRDRFDTSRKYAIALLEHLDKQGITRRVGDERVRGKNA